MVSNLDIDDKGGDLPLGGEDLEETLNPKLRRDSRKWL